MLNGGIETSAGGVEGGSEDLGDPLHIGGQDGERGKRGCRATSPRRCPWQEYRSEEEEPSGLPGVWNALPLGAICFFEAFALQAEKLEGSQGKAWVCFVSQVPYCGHHSSKVFEVR